MPRRRPQLQVGLSWVVGKRKRGLGALRPGALALWQQGSWGGGSSSAQVPAGAAPKDVERRGRGGGCGAVAGARPRQGASPTAAPHRTAGTGEQEVQLSLVDKAKALLGAFTPAYWQTLAVVAILYFARFDASFVTLRAKTVRCSRSLDRACRQAAADSASRSSRLLPKRQWPGAAGTSCQQRAHPSCPRLGLPCPQEPLPPCTTALRSHAAAPAPACTLPEPNPALPPGPCTANACR